VVGSGGREHALCWKLGQSPRRPAVYCAPGNAGTRLIAENVKVAAEDIEGLIKFAKKERIDLTVVGPEDPLCAGIADKFQVAGLRIFGPSAAAAKLEGDKAYAKQLMREAGVPTAEARVFGPTNQEMAQARQSRGQREDAAHPELLTGYEMARHYLSTRDEGVVVKAAGLAKGKGVFVHADPADALLTIEDLMVRKTLGEAGARIVVEDLLIGREVSVMALVDGTTIYMLETASDHKRLGDGDTGPNTGGMGAYSPSDGLIDAQLDAIQRDVFVPTIDGLKREGIDYRGVLYAGMMMTTGGPKVLEFNCRFGDPETQPILMRLKSDLVEALEATVDGRLDQIELEWDARPAICVVMAAGGYPGSHEKGKVIGGLARAGAMKDVQVFHAGTTMLEGEVISSGGRVLGVTAIGSDVPAARARAYEAVEAISMEGAVYRKDIGARVR
jgi:phosphoribosylamine---glycine ligase